MYSSVAILSMSEYNCRCTPIQVICDDCAPYYADNTMTINLTCVHINTLHVRTCNYRATCMYVYTYVYMYTYVYIEHIPRTHHHCAIWTCWMTFTYMYMYMYTYM